MLEILFKLLTGYAIHVGVATNFSYVNDKWNPVPYAACLHRNLRKTDMVVANRTLPCNSRVFVYIPRNKRGTWATVGDRGPRKVMVDLSPAITHKLHANGWEWVVMMY